MRKLIAVTAIVLSLAAACLSFSAVTFDPNHLGQYVTGPLVGPSVEAAMAANPGVQQAQARSKIAKVIFALIAFAACIQIGLVVTDRRK